MRLHSLLRMSAVLGLLCAAPAFASTITFAQFSQAVAGNQFTFTNNTAGGFSTFTASVPVNFEFLFPGLSGDLTGPQAATLTMTAVTTVPAQSINIPFAFLAQPFNVLSTLAIVRNAPATLGDNSRTNLLTVDFTGFITGAPGAGSGNLNGDTAIGTTVNYSSDFLDFSNTSARNFALSFSSITPALAIDGSFLRSFSTAGTGTFASNPLPLITAIPEPGTMAALGMGLALMGVMRRRK